MQADLGSAITTEGVPVHYAYAARYSYDAEVIQNDNLVRVSPYADRYQRFEYCSVESQPPSTQVSFIDRFGNLVHRLRVTLPHSELILTSVGKVVLLPPPSTVPEVPLESITPDLEVAQFLDPSRLVKPNGLVDEVAIEEAGDARGLLDAVNRVTLWVYEAIEYQRGTTSVITTAEEVLHSGKGVCQDKTHLALGMLRALKIPARYVSGMLTRQVGETHAWVEFYHPDLGWLPADPTRGIVLTSDVDYLKLGVGRDYADVPPINGHFVSSGSGELSLVVARGYFDRENVTTSDALSLLDITLPAED
ncbi:MAG: transglutaminase domain-containing protein [Dehalococcoidia bacterium]